MEFDRAALKLKARQSMSGRRPSAILVSLVYLLLTMGLSVAVVLVLLQPFVNLTLTAAFTEMGDRELLRMLVSYLPFWLIGLVLGLVVTLFSYVMAFGYQGYVLRLARGQEAGWRELMGGFSSLGRALGVYLMVGIFSALWYLAAYVPAGVLQYLMEWLFPVRMQFLAVLLGLALNAAACVFYLSRILRYSLAPLALADQPELGVFGAIRRSKELMQGRRWEFFKLNLSFLGWYLLEVLVVLAGYWVSIVAMTFLAGFGLWGAGGASMDQILEQFVLLVVQSVWVMPLCVAIASMLYLMWLQPYVSTTVAHYYCWITDTQAPAITPPASGQGGEPPQWRYQNGGGGDHRYNGGAPDSRRDPDKPF